MRDHLFIEGLSIDCLIGLAKWERMVKQTVVLDFRLGVELGAAASRDSLSEGDFNTKIFSRRLREFVEASEYQLIETLAEKVATLVLEEFPVRWVQVRLSKPRALRGADNVGVVITRGEISP